MSVAGKMLLAGGAVTGVLLLIAAFAVSQYTHRVARNLSHDYAGALSQGAVASVDGQIAEASATARAIADTVGQAHAGGVRDRATVVAMLKPAATATPLVLGAWFMAAPDAFDGRDGEMAGRTAAGSNSQGRFLPYWVNDGGQTRLQPLDSGTDYDQAYFTVPTRTGKPAITEPYAYDVGGKSVLMTSIAYPVMSGGKMIGVAGLDLALDDISTMLGRMKPFGSGRTMLLTSGGNWASHPDAALLTKPYAEAGAEAVRTVLSAGEPTRLNALRDLSGQKVERLVTPVSLRGLGSTWGLVTDIPTAAINGHSNRLAVAMMVGGMVILGMVLACLFVASDRVVRRPLARLTASVNTLNQGRYDVAVQGVDSRDEVGGIARALEGFRHDLAEAVRLRAEQEEGRAAAEAERHRNDAIRRQAEEEQRLVVASLGEGLERLSDGDLTYRLKVDFPADYRKLRQDFNAAMQQLEDTMTVIIGSAMGIRSTTSEISQASDDLSRRTEQQAASLEETAAALEQVTTTIRHASDGAARARDVMETTRGNAERSGAVVQETVAAMNAIEESSGQIARITGVIDEIAFQTNLLALNAGVEAARAGEAGRGFAVVASEVRALAQRSGEAAKEIRDLISGSAQRVAQGVRLVDDTGDALARIITEITEISGLVSDIAASAQEQALGLGQINTAVAQMDQMTQQNAAMVEESTAAAHALAQETAGLGELMSRFRTGEGSSPRAAPTRGPAPVVEPPAAPVVSLKTVGGRGRSAAAAVDDWEEF
ncbi:MAG: methyl-accepting chemotaxis protein [Bordetella sp.]|nr:methyl-accepting chemotaxis protein [Bordetella sp.]